MTHYIPEFPQEVCDHIMDHLWDDKRALAACGLTCRAWVPTSRRHIFDTVFLRSEEDFTRLNTLLEGSQYIPQSVRDVRIQALDSEQPDWLLMFKKLPRVEKLTIKSWYARAFPAEVKAQLRTLLPAVKLLHLASSTLCGDDLPTLLCALPELLSLNLHNVHVIGLDRHDESIANGTGNHEDEDEDADADENDGEVVDQLPKIWSTISPITTPRLETLCWNCGPQYLDIWLSNMFGPTQLHTLELWLSWQPYLPRFVSTLMQAAGAALEDLTVVIGGPGVPPPLDLSRHPHLVSLRFQMHLSEPNTLWCEWIVAALAAITPAHLRFKEIHLSLRFRYRWNICDPLSLPQFKWQDIDAALVRVLHDHPQAKVILVVDECPAKIAHPMVDHIWCQLPQSQAEKARISRSEVSAKATVHSTSTSSG